MTKMQDINKIAKRIPSPIRGTIERKGRAVANYLRGDAIHLFLLSPPLSGSTVIAQLIATSPNVTTFPSRGGGEGQFLPGASEILYVDNRWNPNLQIDWKKIKWIFYSYWSPLKPIRFEKSPPHIVRAMKLEQAFHNSYFLITIRNPYAVIEGLIRRKWPFNEFGPQSTPSSSPTPKAAARFWVESAKYQIHNLKHLQKSLFFTYEELTDTPDQVAQKMINFLPGLGSIETETEFTAHNMSGKPIVGLKNLNQRKIDNLKQEQINDINGILRQHEDILSHFQYRLI